MQDGPPAAVQTVTSEPAATPWQVGLAWLLAHSPVTLPIPGTSNPEHLRENVAASQLSLRDEQRVRLDGIDERPEH